jgi:hypothetical protein
MIRQLIIGVSVAVIGVGAHAAKAEAAAGSGSCHWELCFSEDECLADGAWQYCRSTTPPGCMNPIEYCINGWSAECGGGGYVDCYGMQIE